MIFGGIKVISDANMVDTVPAWEICRSIPRAMRRVKQGKRPMPLKQVPSSKVHFIDNRMCVCHPSVAAKIRQQSQAV